MRKSAGVLLATAVLALSSACGGSGSGDRAESEPQQRDVAAAADRSSDEAPLTRENFVERLSAAQLDAGSAHMAMTVSAAGTEVAMEGDIRVDEDVEKSASRITMDLGPMAMDVRLVDGVMYLKMGEMTRGKYVEIDLDDPDNPMAKQFGSMTKQADPAGQLKTFDEALVSFENEGDGGEIDGVQTTKLTLVVDTAEALGDQADQAGRLGTQMPKELEYVLFIGQDDDLLRRITMDLAQAPMTIDWSRWGEEVDVQAPKRSEITDAPAFAFPTAGAMAG